MLNKEPKTNAEDSSGGEYVLLEAEEPEEEITVEPQVDEEAPLVTEPSRDLIEEASDLLLDQAAVEDDVSTLTSEGSRCSHDEAQSKSGASDAEIVKDADILAEEAGDAEGVHDTKDRETEEAVEDARGDDDTKPEEDEENTPPEDREPEDATDSKENNDPTSTKGAVDVATTNEFRFGTRGEVNGAAAVFGVTALLIGGPVAGVLVAAASAHIAANKPCKCAKMTRACGGVLNNIGKKKRLEMAAKIKAEGGNRNKPNVWDKITDRLVEGGVWTEKKLTPRRRA